MDEEEEKGMKMDVLFVLDLLNIERVLEFDLSTFGSQSWSSSWLERVLRWSSALRLTHPTWGQIYFRYIDQIFGVLRGSSAFGLTLT